MDKRESACLPDRESQCAEECACIEKIIWVGAAQSMNRVHRDQDCLYRRIRRDFLLNLQVVIGGLGQFLLPKPPDIISVSRRIQLYQKGGSVTDVLWRQS